MPVRRELEAALSASAGVSMQYAADEPMPFREGDILMQLATVVAQMQTLLVQGGLPREIKEQALRDAALRGDSAAITRMLAHKDVRIDAADPTNWATALHLAASRGHVAAVEILLAAGASGDAALRSKVSDASGYLTVLEHAVNGQSAHVVNLLLAEETSTLLSLSEKQSILRLAAEMSLGDVFGVLAKADAFAETREGAEKFLESALRKATTKGDMQLIGDLIAFAPALEQRFSCNFRWEAIDAQLNGSFYPTSVAKLQKLFSYPHYVSSTEAFECTREKFSYEYFQSLVRKACIEDPGFGRLGPTRGPKLDPKRAPLVQLLFAEMSPASRIFSLARSEENEDVIVALDLSGSEHFRVELAAGQALSVEALSDAVGDAVGDAYSRFGLPPRLRIFESERELSGMDCETVDRLENITIEIEIGVDLHMGLSKLPITVSDLRTLVDDGDVQKVFNIVCNGNCAGVQK